MPIETNWSVFTGAPCSGKTTVLNALKALGYKCIPEAARMYIETELAKGRSLTEIRADEMAFQKKIIQVKNEVESKLPPQEIVLLDRAMPDSIAYLRLAKLDTTEIMALSKNFRYRHIFIFDPLPLQQDHVRNESEETNLLLDKQHELDYRELGYKPIRVPVMSVQQRVDLILSSVAIQTNHAQI